MSRSIKNHINANKKGLLITLMQCRFEDDVMKYLDEGKYESMEELDAWLDEKLRDFDDTCDKIREWYAPKIAEEDEKCKDEEDEEDDS